MVTGIATGTAKDEAVVVVVEMTTGSLTGEMAVTVMYVSSLLVSASDEVANESVITAP